MLDTKNKEVVDYSANGFDYKLVKEEDNWWSIYRWPILFSHIIMLHHK